MKARYIYGIGLICFAVLMIFLTFNRRSKSGYLNYHSEIWADKAGYYVYLPAAIKFKFDPTNFPDSIETNTGHGFILDHKQNKVRTKYTYGVALMQLPFFLFAEAFAKPLNFEANGFSPIYHWSISVASIFYLIFGLIFLKIFLETRYETRIAILVPLSILLGTNLYYYSVDETGMSHIYSFFLFCYFLYYLQRTNFLLKQSLWRNLGFGLLVGLIILVRPSNAVFLCCYFFLDTNGKSDIVERIKRLVQYRTFLPVVLGMLMVFLPQLIYWEYTYGSLVTYSYGNEGFNWTNPELLKTWFSPNNGLFLYTPFYFLIVGSLIYMIVKRINTGAFILAVFFVISYVFSSWWDWSFGCAFGARSYVEYLALFSIPLAYGFSYISQLSTGKIIGFCLIVFTLIVFNLKMTYSYDGCFYGEREWDWPAFLELVKSPTK